MTSASWHLTGYKGAFCHMRGPWECTCVRVCVFPGISRYFQALNRLGLLCCQSHEGEWNPSTQSLFLLHEQRLTSSLHCCRAIASQQQLECETHCLLNQTIVFERFVVCFLFFSHPDARPCVPSVAVHMCPYFSQCMLRCWYELRVLRSCRQSAHLTSSPKIQAINLFIHSAVLLPFFCLHCLPYIPFVSSSSLCISPIDFIPVSLHFSHTLSCTQLCSGCEHEGKKRKRVERKAKHIAVAG